MTARGKNNPVETIAVSLVYFTFLLYLFGTTHWYIYGWHDQQRILQVGLLVVLFLMWSVCRVAYRFSPCDESRASIILDFPLLHIMLFAGFALFGLTSALLAAYPHWALLEWALLLSICLGAVHVAEFRRVNEYLFDRIVLLIIIGVCALYFLGFMARYATLFAGVPLRVWDMFSGFSNIRFFGQFQTMTLPLLAVAVMCAQSPLRKWSAFGLLSCWWMLSIASGTRGTWLAMFVALTVVWLIGRRLARSWISWQVLAIVTGLILYGVLFFAIPCVFGEQLETINRLPALTSLSARDVLWARAWQMIVVHPLLGFGPMHFATEPNGIGAHPHNSILQIGAEWGIPALLMSLSLIVVGLYRLVKVLRMRGEDASLANVLAMSLFAALVAAATQSLVDGVIVMPYSQVMLMLIVGWSMSVCNATLVSSPSIAFPPALGATQTDSARWPEVLFGGIAVVLLALLIILALPDVPYLHEKMQQYRDLHHGTLFLPRFWQQGWIDE